MSNIPATAARIDIQHAAVSTAERQRKVKGGRRHLRNLRTAQTLQAAERARRCILERILTPALPPDGEADRHAVCDAIYPRPLTALPAEVWQRRAKMHIDLVQQILAIAPLPNEIRREASQRLRAMGHYSLEAIAAHDIMVSFTTPMLAVCTSI
jgi:hypothetical protein